MIELSSGVITAVIIIIAARLLSKHFPYRLIVATILVAIAFIYVGFSLTGGSISMIILNITVALAFYFLALFGYEGNNKLLAYGIILHGVWDLIHHTTLVEKSGTPDYWPVFCFIVDLIDGFLFLYIFTKDKTPALNK